MQFLRKVYRVLSFVGLIAVPAYAGVASSGSTVALGGLEYFIPPSPSSQLKLGGSTSLKNTSSWIPFTFVQASGGNFTDSDFSSAISKYQSSDDVWTPSFLSGEIDFRSLPLPLL